MAGRLTVPFARGSDTLPLVLAAGTAAQATVTPYDFAEHAAQFGRPPDPRYVVAARRDLPVPFRLTVAYEVRPPAAPPTLGTAILDVPAGELAGASFMLDLGAHEGPRTRLLTLAMAPAAPAGAVEDWWQLTALLGNLARLLWAVGWERDHIRRQAARVMTQRRLADAVGLSLDLLGADLGIPRFPPLPHAFDPDTVALYHLDDAAGATPDAEDTMLRYGGVGHPGTNVGGRALPGAPGRFGAGFGFRDPAAEIRIASHAEFDLDATRSFTVECFLKPDAGAGDGHVVAKHADPAVGTQTGWALSVGEFGRGVPGSLRFLLSDGTTQVQLFADETLSATRFHHVAGVLDRQAREARLYVDGAIRAIGPAAALGALTNAEPVRIGRAGAAAFRGVVDEVRLSRVARSAFAPALGEPDGSYRERLRIFERWTLPAPPDLLRILNEAVGPIGGVANPLILDDADATLLSGTAALTVLPRPLGPGECIDALGNRRAREATVSGTAATEPGFDPAYLARHDDPRAVYTAPAPRTLQAGERPSDPHLMQAVTAGRLDGLLALLAAEGIPGQLRVESGFDPRADDLRRVGRALWLSHPDPGLGPGGLAVLAHRAGFTFVCRRPADSLVYASAAPGDYAAITVTGGTATTLPGFDARVGETLELAIRPVLPADTLYRWVTIACGAGRTRFATLTDRPVVTLDAMAPGEVVVKVEATRRHRTVAGTRVFRIAPADLADGQSIGGDGTLGASEAIAGAPDPFFHPAYLVTHDDARASYGADVNTRRMQLPVARRLDRLLDLIAGTGVPGPLAVTAAYVPGATDLSGQGRALTVRPPAALLPRLGALAHAAGFTWVRRQGAVVNLRQAPDEVLAVRSSAATVVEGAGVGLSVSPRAASHGVAIGTGAVYVANSGTDTVSEVDPGTGSVRRAIKVGWRPVAALVSPNGQRLYTADASGNSVSVVTLATGAVQRIAVGRQPVALAHHPTQPRLYVACLGTNTLVPINTTTLAVLPALAVGAGPTGLAVTPNGAELWVTLSVDRRINVVSTASMTSVASIALTDEPLDVAMAPDGVRAYVSFPAAARVRVLGVAPRSVLDQLTLGLAPGALAVAPDGSAVYVADRGAGAEQLHVLEPRVAAPMLVVRGGVRVRRDPVDVAADTSRVYVANRGSDDVSVIDPATGSLGLVTLWRMGTGLGERFTWVLRLGGPAGARLGSTTDPDVTLTGERAGRVLARAVYSLADGTDPYTFVVRLTPALEAAGAVVRKDQYDRIMNVLNALHPIGVEVSTRALRERVIEVRAGLLDAFPDYTYPNFRARSPLPRRARKD
jgi:YVTN family beta-propeller protein